MKTMKIKVTTINSELSPSDWPAQYLVIRYKNKIIYSNYFINFRENIAYQTALEQLNLKLKKLGCKVEKLNGWISDSYCYFTSEMPYCGEGTRNFMINTAVNMNELNKVLTMESDKLFDYLSQDGILELFPDKNFTRVTSPFLDLIK